MARWDNIWNSLETRFKVVIEIAFLWKIRDKLWQGVIRGDKMWQDVITFEVGWKLNLKLSLKLLFYERLGINCDKVW